MTENSTSTPSYVRVDHNSNVASLQFGQNLAIGNGNSLNAGCTTCGNGDLKAFIMQNIASNTNINTNGGLNGRLSGPGNIDTYMQRFVDCCTAEVANFCSDLTGQIFFAVNAEVVLNMIGIICAARAASA